MLFIIVPVITNTLDIYLWWFLYMFLCHFLEFFYIVLLNIVIDIHEIRSNVQHLRTCWIQKSCHIILVDSFLFLWELRNRIGLYTTWKYCQVAQSNNGDNAATFLTKYEGSYGIHGGYNTVDDHLTLPTPWLVSS